MGSHKKLPKNYPNYIIYSKSFDGKNWFDFFENATSKMAKNDVLSYNIKMSIESWKSYIVWSLYYYYFLFGQNGIPIYLYRIDAQQRFLFQLYFYTQYMHIAYRVSYKNLLEIKLLLLT